MKDELLAALLDLRIALGELQASMMDVDRAVRELMALQLEVKKEESKRGEPPRQGQG
jgi:hypothetical protein